MIVILPALAFVTPPALETVTPGDYDVPVSTALDNPATSQGATKWKS